MILQTSAWRRVRVPIPQGNSLLDICQSSASSRVRFSAQSWATAAVPIARGRMLTGAAPTLGPVLSPPSLPWTAGGTGLMLHTCLCLTYSPHDMLLLFQNENGFIFSILKIICFLKV